MPSAIHPAITEGNVAVITGGASGIGLATAERLARSGLRVYIADLDEDALKEAAASLADTGEVIAQTTDVSDAASVEELGNTVADRLGPDV